MWFRTLKNFRRKRYRSIISHCKSIWLVMLKIVYICPNFNFDKQLARWKPTLPFFNTYIPNHTAEVYLVPASIFLFTLLNTMLQTLETKNQQLWKRQKVKSFALTLALASRWAWYFDAWMRRDGCWWKWHNQQMVQSTIFGWNIVIVICSDDAVQSTAKRFAISKMRPVFNEAYIIIHWWLCHDGIILEIITVYTQWRILSDKSFGLQTMGRIVCYQTGAQSFVSTTQRETFWQNQIQR